EFSPKNPNTLWYKTSAEATGVSYPWMEYALPLGNGELGCMVFGGVHNEEIQFNEKTLWSGAANQVGAGSGNRTFMNFGSVFVENKDNAITDGVTDYVRYLDIEEGIAGVAFKNSNGSKFTRKYLSSAPDQVIAAQYKAEGEDKMNLNFTLEPGEGIGAGSVVYENGMASFTGQMTVKYACRLHVVADEGATVTSSAKGITVQNATNVTFYLKGATNFNGDTDATGYFYSVTPEAINEEIKTAIETASAKGYEAVEAAHIEDFTAITKRMTFNMGLQTPSVDTKTLVDNYYPKNTNGTSTANDHLFLEQLYFHFGRYLAISSNRKPIAAPNNLQGIWNDRGADSPWNSDIHTNINIQMNYWPTEITNLSDLHKPFVNFILRGANSAGWKEVGKRYNDGYGWSVLTETSLYNSMSTWGDNYLVANVWYTSHLWTHWRYTQDKEFLAKAFPVMWDCAEFWFHRLIEDRGFDSSKDEQQSVRNYKPAYKFDPDGTFVAPNEFSAEQHDNQTEDGTAHAQQMIYYLFQNLSDAIGILGVENTGLSTEDVDKLNLYLDKTDKGLHTETYTGSWGANYNGVKTGDKLLREWKYSPFDISNDRGHRHMSHMMALFPMDQITPESEFFTPAVNSLKLRGDAATGWSMGWKVNLWARAQDGDHAHIIIKNALKHSTDYGTNAGAGGIYYNLFDSHAPFQIDGNFGVCSGIAEMLMQSAHGYINIMPAIPSVWNKQGDVKGMKAMGNFTVDFNWSAGKCQAVRIQSHMGAPLKVRCDKGAMPLNKASVKVNGADVTVTVDENGIATIPCEKDGIVEIDFTTATGISSVADAAAKGESPMYDLSGRRIKETPAGQVYIQNGSKKVAK
ncbi:MAG: glycoside hydrolase family 95 protein, partial [Bacteroidaceae bacterium]|nr:glycoside hydrolase family 95 protein [Bacteroidaceae bacterium]